MALESLADKYNNLGDDKVVRSQNTTRREKPTSDLDKLKKLYQPFSKVAEKILFGNPVTTDYSVSMEYKNFYTGGTILTGPLATGVHSGARVYGDLGQDKIKKRKVDIENLGTAGKLGFDPFILESLYLKSHKNNPDRQPINTGRVDHLGNPIVINTLRAGMGNPSGLDIKGYSTDEIFYRGSHRGNEPYFVAPINSEDDFPGSHTSRLLKFYKSPKGQEALYSEALLSALHNIEINPFKLRLPGPGFIARGAISIAQNLFKVGHDSVYYNLVGQQLNIDYAPVLSPIDIGGGHSITIGQVVDLGNVLGSLQRPFSIEYSAQRRTGQPFGDLGDRPWNLSILKGIKKVRINEKEDPKIKTYLRKQQNKIHKAGLKETKRIQDQTVSKVSPFYDLTGGPGDHKMVYALGPNPIRLHGYDDKISNSGVEYEMQGPSPVPSEGTYFPGMALVSADPKPPLEEVIGTGQNVHDGDFYVRFKDLRDGGYIYFRGYINGITENLSPAWTTTNYIGRSEPVHSYQRAERDISFNLAVYPQNFEQEEFMYEKMNRLTSMVYPEYTSGEIRMKKPPFTEMFMAHIGSKTKGQFGYIKTLSYTVNEQGDWNSLELLPRVFNIAISYQIVSKKSPSIESQFYRTPTTTFWE